MIWKFLKQNVLSPKGLNWVKHLVSRIGLLSDLKRWTKNRYIGNRTIIIRRVKQASTCHEHHAFRKKKSNKGTQSWCLLIKSTIANCCSCCRCRGGQYNNNNNNNASFLTKRKWKTSDFFQSFKITKWQPPAVLYFLLACVASVSVWFREQREIFGSFSFSAPK